MKPRTKLQFEVMRLAQNYLLPVKEVQKNWAFKNCFKHIGFANKSRVACMDCGESFSLELISRNKATCPHCKTKIEIDYSRMTTMKQKEYFAIATIVGDFQVIRNFEITSRHKAGNKISTNCYEILQHWILPNGKREVIARNHSYSWYADSWNGLMEIRDKSNYRKYDVFPLKYYPDSYFKHEYTKIGIDENLQFVSALECIREVPNNSKAETLLKMRQYQLLGSCLGQSGRVNRYWNSLKICFRNKYKINDITMYFDYLELLSYFHKDLQNAVYVCPKNLKKEHDKYLVKKQEIERIRQEQRQEQQRIERQKNLERANRNYITRNKKFFDLEFNDDTISIKVLRSIKEFEKEGTELKHCVYTNEYYLEEDSLILSAKVDGKRTETIEVILSKMKIEQSRGYDNKPSKHNKKIVALMKKNINKIRAIIEKPKQKQKKSKNLTIKNQAA